MDKTAQLEFSSVGNRQPVQCKYTDGPPTVPNDRIVIGLGFSAEIPYGSTTAAEIY